MNALQLVKHHGLGNDFLIAFHVDLPEPELADVGASGVRPPPRESAPTGC